MGKFKETIERWWREASAIATLVFVIVQFESVKSDAEEAKTIMQQQVEINRQLTAQVDSVRIEGIRASAKVQVYLEMRGVHDTIAAQWAAMPREAPHDSLGNGIPWTPWIEADTGLVVGVKCMFNDSGRVLVDTLWSFRSKKK